MNTHSYPHTIVLLSSSFKKPNRRLFFTRARLFFDRIELTGWAFGKKYSTHIFLNEIDKIEWDAEASGAVFFLTEGHQVHLELPEMQRWKQSLETRFQWNTSGAYPLPLTTVNSTLRRDLPLQDVVTFTTCMG